MNPELLERLARSVVRIRSGDEWGTGFVFGSPHHVIASYQLVSASSDIEVVLADNLPRRVEVLAWSKKDDLALLELGREAPAPPLEMAANQPMLGASIAALYQPAEPDVEADSDEAHGWAMPIALFGRVARVLPGEIDLDLGLWGRHGDCGAPIVNADGRVVAIVSCSSDAQQRSIATRVERADRLLRLLERQGESWLTRNAKAFAGAFVTPIATDGMVGAGLTLGIAYDWLALELLEGLFQTGYQPIGESAFETTKRFQLELDAHVQIRLTRATRLFLGPAVQLNLDWIQEVEDVASGPLVERDDHRVRVRPAGTLGFVSGFVYFRASISEEPRLDLGIVIGR